MANYVPSTTFDGRLAEAERAFVELRESAAKAYQRQEEVNNNLLMEVASRAQASECHCRHVADLVECFGETPGQELRSVLDTKASADPATQSAGRGGSMNASAPPFSVVYPWRIQ